MQITSDLLDKLSAEARACERLRMPLDLRTSANDQSQRMLNAMEPGTILPIHRHPNTCETVIMLRGSVKELIYDDKGNLVESIILKAGKEPFAMSIPAGVWHGLECLESGTILFEAKDGAFEPRKEEDILNIK